MTYNKTDTAAQTAGKGKSKALITILIIILIAAGAVMFFIYKKMNDISIDKVKDSYFNKFPDITAGELLDEIHKKPESKNDAPLWTEKKSLSGCTVEFKGENIYGNYNVEVHFVSGDDGKPEVNYVSIDGEETDADGLAVYIEGVYRNYLGRELRDDDRHAPKVTADEVT